MSYHLVLQKQRVLVVVLNTHKTLIHIQSDDHYHLQTDSR